MFSIVLIEPAIEENIGSTARVMKNFGFKHLILVRPQCTIGENARRLAKHAQDILENAEIINDFSEIKQDFIIGTTSKLGSDYNLTRTPITPKELLGSLESRPAKSVALVFGREANGLLNEEIKRCDTLVSIPSTREYSALNLSHAVAILLYELSPLIDEEKINKVFVMASKDDRRILTEFAERVIDGMHFSTDDKRETQRTLWRRLINKAFLTKREAFALIGFLKKIINR